MNIQITIWLIFVFASLINSVLDLKTMHISLLVNYLCLGFTVFLCVYQKINIIENIISGILLFYIFLATRKLSNNWNGRCSLQLILRFLIFGIHFDSFSTFGSFLVLVCFFINIFHKWEIQNKINKTSVCAIFVCCYSFRKFSYMGNVVKVVKNREQIYNTSQSRRIFSPDANIT